MQITTQIFIYPTHGRQIAQILFWARFSGLIQTQLSLSLPCRPSTEGGRTAIQGGVPSFMISFQINLFGLTLSPIVPTKSNPLLSGTALSHPQLFRRMPA